MPLRMVPDSDFDYYLIPYDAAGVECVQNGELTSTQVIHAVADTSVTDVVLISHGWNGDLPAAIGQFDRWIASMLGCSSDRARVSAANPNFRALVIGLHWPSKAWGDETLPQPDASFGSVNGAGGAAEVTDLIEFYSSRLGGGPAVDDAVKTVIRVALEDPAPEKLPPEVVAAYRVLDEQSGLRHDGVGAAPGNDRQVFDPELTYQAALAEEEFADFASFGLGGLLAPLRTLTFWAMKKRARTFGEGSAGMLLAAVKAAVPEGRRIRFHLVGHSFGCIVASSCLMGPPGGRSHTASSLTLVQGALSLWSYCSAVPDGSGMPGYFRRLIVDGLVTGPILTTRSVHDRAVGTFYPLGAGAAGQVDFQPGELPKYGGVGSFGARGPGVSAEDLPMKPVTELYDFQPGGVYNIEASDVINQGGGPSGAHSDICHPEVAHAVWQAIECGATLP